MQLVYGYATETKETNIWNKWNIQTHQDFEGKKQKIQGMTWQTRISTLLTITIGGFRGGAEGAVPPLFSKHFCMTPFPLTMHPENRFIKCSLILSFETLTLLYFASRIYPQCCMLHLLKSEVFIWRGREVGDSSPSFWIFWIHPKYKILLMYI